METIKRVLEFLRRWGAAMTGMAGLPATIWGATHQNSSSAAALVASGYIALLVCAIWQGFKIWQLENALKPRLTLACGPDVPGSVVPNRWNGGSNLFFRIAIKSDCDTPVRNCQGRLIAIRGATTRWQGDTAVLTFAPSEHSDAEAKTIHPKVTVHLDVLVILFGPANNFLGILPGTKDRQWRFQPGLADLFGPTGDFILTVQVVGDGLPTITRTLEFKWRGPQNSELRLL